MRKVFVIIAVVAVVVCGVGGWFVYNGIRIGDQIATSSITQAQFDAQQVGGGGTTGGGPVRPAPAGRGKAGRVELRLLRRQAADRGRRPAAVPVLLRRRQARR